MTLRLYMDHHVRKAVTQGLRRRGIDVVTAEEDGLAGRQDADILARGTELGRIVFTQDDDFLAIADEWIQAGRPFAGLAYAHQQKITTGQAVRDLELLCKASTEEQMRNQVQFLPFGD